MKSHPSTPMHDDRFDIATLGEAMVMLIADQAGPLEQVKHFTKFACGAEINVAIGLARLGFDVRWAGRLGADSMGRYLIDKLRGEGVDCSRVAMDASRGTGFQFKARSADGADPVVEYHRKGSAASRMRPADLDERWLDRARHLHLTGVFAAVSPETLATSQRALEVARTAGHSVSFDPNLRPSLWANESRMRNEINALAVQADWVLPGLAEGRLLTGQTTPEEIAAFYRHQGVRLVTVKLGRDGAYFDDAGAGRGYVPASPVEKIVDTVGAGDAFAVGIISGLLDGLDVRAAVRRACWCGARQVQVLGDSEGLPTRADLAAAGQ